MKHLRFLFLLVAMACAKENKFVLITNVYNETNPERLSEYITCLQNNLEHELIEEIHVIYDVSADPEKNSPMAKFLHDNDITISYKKGRPTYGFCFEIANTLYPGRTIILANADIYFNNTLHKLHNYDLANKFLALTRWNVTRDGNLKIYKWFNDTTPATGSQDAWIFKAPLKKFKDDIVMGLKHCDIRIIYHARSPGLHISNPCLDVQCCHLHLSNIRHYPMVKLPRKIPRILSLPWCHLK